MYITRHIENEIKKASQYYPVVMVCGQRQVGKSTLLYHLKAESRKYVTLDDINARRLAETDPPLFFETYGMPLLIDEFQRAPALLLEIKRIVDEKALKGEDAVGLFWLTGSQKFKMMKNVSDSLSGRTAVFDLSSLSAAEIENRPAALFSPELSALKERMKSHREKDLYAVFSDIFRGGMPKLVTTDIDRDRYYMDYVNTYLERDIRELAQVGNINQFYDFLVYMAARTSQILNYSEIARAIGVSTPTAKSWVTILERSGVIFILPPYHGNITKRLTKAAKCYFLDTGLAAYLCRWPTPETLANGAMDGAFFETYVISEIVKSYYNAGKYPDLYFYRDIDQHEIDLLLIRGDKLYPVEIKKAKTPSHANKHFHVLEKFGMEVQPGVIICMNNTMVPYDKTTWYFPVSAL